MESVMKLLGGGAWPRTNYLLALRLAADVPHVHLGADRTMDRIRALAKGQGGVFEKIK